MNTLQESRKQNEELLAELDSCILFLSDECKEKRAEDNAAAVRDLTSHIVKLKKERIALAEKMGKLISLAEAKQAISEANDPTIAAIEEIAPDLAPMIYKRAAELYYENEQAFEG